MITIFLFYRPHKYLSDDVHVSGGIFSIHSFGQKHTIFPKTWRQPGMN
jgi:hypothetical protein